MRIAGWLFLIIGALAALAALFMDTSVPVPSGGRVHNIGLLRSQENGLLVGLALFVAGALFLALDRSQRGGEGNGRMMRCPMCAATIPSGSTTCSSCNRFLDRPLVARAQPTTPGEDEVMKRHGIARDGDAFVYKSIRYAHLRDALRSAQQATTDV